MTTDYYIISTTAHLNHRFFKHLAQWDNKYVNMFAVPDESREMFLEEFKNYHPEPFLKAYTIPGWMTHAELRWLHYQAKQYKLIAEIGSWQGRSTTALAHGTKAKVYAIDTWRGCGEVEYALKREGFPVDYEQTYEDFQRNLWREIEAFKVVPIRSKSKAAASLFPDCYFDMVFIDAEHTYNSCSEDIQVWRPKVKPGGLLCGHDFDNVNWPSVVKAVQENIKTQIYNVEDTAIWFTYTDAVAQSGAQ